MAGHNTEFTKDFFASQTNVRHLEESNSNITNKGDRRHDAVVICGMMRKDLSQNLSGIGL